MQKSEPLSSEAQNLEIWLPYHLAYVSAEQLLKIQNHFGSLQAGLQATENEWTQAHILRPKQLEMLFAKTVTEKVQQILAWQQADLQHIVTLADAHYPPLLREIDDAPILLYVKGQVALLSDPQLAIVGSRHASKLGIQVAEDFSSHLSQQGLTITSGLASGIDTAAHRGALQGIGSTLAVMGTGIDRIYPASNRALAHQIAEQGALVTEFPLGARPDAFHFPRRNRIISGLSVGTLVVEATLKSGSLITAKTAMEQGREVFAVPGSINNPQAKGCHQLIKQGAKLVETGQEVLEELTALIELSLQPALNQESNPAQTTLFDASANEAGAKLMRYIEYEPISLDELVVLSKMPASEIQAQLMLLELEGVIESLSGGRWRRLK